MEYFGGIIFDTFLLLIGILTLLWVFLKYKYSYWDRNGYKTLPDFYYITGHFKFDFGKKFIGVLLAELYNTTTEPFIGAYFMFQPWLLIRDPELIRSILQKDFAHFTDRWTLINEKNDPLNSHLFALPGQRWKNLRAKLTPTFTTGKLKSMFPTLIQCGSTLQKFLDKSANNGELVDVKEISACFTTNVIASVSFGIEVDSINDPSNEFRVFGRNILGSSFTFSNMAKRILIQLAPNLSSSMGLKLFDPDMENFIMSVVKQNVEYRENKKISRKDFFQLLIQIRNTGKVQLDGEWDTVIKSNESEKMMTLDEIAAQTFLFFVAGFDTSASTLSFCLYELAKNPDIQQRVHQEIDTVLAKHNGRITYESMSEMKFSEHCIEETLRLYPIISFLTRRCVQDYKIPGTDKVIPKGIEVQIPVFALHRDKKYYNEPNKFNPDRFSGENQAGKDQLNHPYLPFGDGPRNCIGLRLGKMQTLIGLVLMLQKYRYELDDRDKNRDMEFDPKGLLLSSKGAIELKLFKR